MFNFRFIYFVDRIGDTFRWKGENVATNQVAEIIGTAAGVVEATVYGVCVHRCEGRAGMAYMVVEKATWDPDSFYRHVCRDLPPFARPLFLRLGPSMQTTATFKYRKVDLVNDGFCPQNSGADELWIADPKSNRYRVLDDEMYNKIVQGIITF